MDAVATGLALSQLRTDSAPVLARVCCGLPLPVSLSSGAEWTCSIDDGGQPIDIKGSFT